MNWRRIIKIIHRDLGYFSFGLVIIYSISGIAVNHINDWNPNFIIKKTTLQIPTVKENNLTADQTLNHVLVSLSIKDSVKNFFRSTPTKISIFLEGRTLEADVSTGKVAQEIVIPRTVFKETNYLHLNVPKKYWTYIADGFAVSLIFLATTGLFMIRGIKGVAKRGKWFVIAGIFIPIIFLLIYYQ